MTMMMNNRYSQLGESLMRVIQSEKNCRDLVEFLTWRQNGVANNNVNHNKKVDVIDIEQSYNYQQQKFVVVDESNLQQCDSFIFIPNNNFITNNKNNKQTISQRIQFDDNIVQQKNHYNKKQIYSDRNEFIQQEQLSIFQTKNIKRYQEQKQFNDDINNINQQQQHSITKNNKILKCQQQQQQQEYFELKLINQFSHQKVSTPFYNCEQIHIPDQQTHQVKIYQLPNKCTNNNTNTSNTNCFNLSNFNSFNNINTKNSRNSKSDGNDNNNYNETMYQFSERQFYQQQVVYLIKRIQLVYGRKLSQSGIKKIINQLYNIAEIDGDIFGYNEQQCNQILTNEDRKNNDDSLIPSTTVNTQRMKQKKSNQNKKFKELQKLKDVTNTKINTYNFYNNSQSIKDKSMSKHKPIQKLQFSNHDNKKIKFSTLPQTSQKSTTKMPLVNIYASKQQNINKQNNSYYHGQKSILKKSTIKQKQRSLSPLSYRVLMEKKKQQKQLQKTQKKNQQNYNVSVKKFSNKQNYHPQKYYANDYHNFLKAKNNQSIFSSFVETPTQTNISKSKPLSLKIILQQNNFNSNMKNKTKTLTLQYQQIKNQKQILRLIQRYCEQNEINKKNMNIIMEAVNQRKPILTIKSIGC